MTTHCLEIIELGCTRGDRTLFDGLSVRVAGGELLYVSGSNGSGKTTLLRSLCGLSRPASGEIHWNGVSTTTLGDEYRRQLVYVGHADGIQGELNLIENLRAHACLHGRSAPVNAAIHAALERLGIDGYQSFPAKLLSQGQRRRLALARLLVTELPCWILDEPFTALDVRSCRLVGELLAAHVAGGGIAIVSSHQDFEAPGISRNRVDLDTLRTHMAAGVSMGVAAAPTQAERLSG